MSLDSEYCVYFKCKVLTAENTKVARGPLNPVQHFLLQCYNHHADDFNFWLIFSPQAICYSQRKLSSHLFITGSELKIVLTETSAKGKFATHTMTVIPGLQSTMVQQ